MFLKAHANVYENNHEIMFFYSFFKYCYSFKKDSESWNIIGSMSFCANLIFVLLMLDNIM